MREKTNIVLLGMPGSGKSTVGVLLAKKLGMRFIDTDLLIQEQEGRLLSEIIKEEGLERFIEIENQVNLAVQAENSVIAPGGSAVYGREAMEHFSACPLCGRLICDHCFMICEEQDMCRSCAGYMQERGEPVAVEYSYSPR